MPLYEYYCEPCHGVFELLRPARESSKAQPCPQCDEDAKRIISREWSAFVFREGSPRRLPDTGGYWHLNKRVSKPLSGRVEGNGYVHPEVKPKPPEKALTPEELEALEFRREQKRRLRREGAPAPGNYLDERRERELTKRLAAARGTEKVEGIKQRFRAREQEIARREKHQAERGEKPRP